MTKINITINKEREFLVIYIVTRGIWTGSHSNRKFVAFGGDIPQTNAIKVTAKNYVEARNIAYRDLNSKKVINEYIKIIKATEIQGKKEVV